MEINQKPILTIGMIVKNEIRCLERCFQSLQPLRDAIPCELIVADTGSTDGTRELAMQYADVCFDFPWCNDFSAARNAVMDRASGDWYLSIDADEFFDEDVSELVAFLSSGQNNHISVCTLTIRNYITPDMLGEFTDFAATRILNMASGIRYTGVIHERWVLPSGSYWHTFTHTILHHDGYAYETKENALRKAERNLALLEPQLENGFSRDGGILMECLDAAIGIPEKAQQYARTCVKWVTTAIHDAHWNELSHAILRKCVEAANRYQMPEFEEWVALAHQMFPESPYTQVDVVYQSIYHYFFTDCHEKVLELVPLYYQGIEKYYSGAYSIRNFGVSGLYRVSIQTQQEVYIMEAMSAATLHQDERALQALRSVPISDNTPPKIAMAILDAAVLLLHCPETPKIVATHMEHLLSVEQTSPRAIARRESCLKRMALSFLPGQAREEWRLYQDVSIDMGKGAQVMAMENPTEIECILGNIQNWGEIPPPVLNHVIACNAHFPLSFYQTQPHEELLPIAKTLGKYDAEFVPHLLQWEGDSFFGTIALNFQVEIIFYALCNPTFAHHKDAVSLLQHLCTLAHRLLSCIYQPNLSQDDISILPSLHQCLWYLVQEEHALQTQQFTQAVSFLNLALKAHPDMKDMIEVQLDNIQQQERLASASPELLQLAEQVKQILSQYEPDDVRLMVIKQSEVYQKVAYLIEETPTHPIP